MASQDYLKDITGKSDAIDFDALIKELGLKGLLPDNARAYLERLERLENDGVHQYQCHIDDMPKNRDCDSSKAIGTRERDRFIGYAQWDTSQPLKLIYLQDGKFTEVDPFALRKQPKPLTLSRKRFVGGKGLRGANTGAYVGGQELGNNPSGTFYTRTVDDDRVRDAQNERFNEAVAGKDGKSIGDRAVYFNPDGSVVKGANNIRDNAIAIERSSNIPSEVLSNGTIPNKIKKAKAYKTSNHPNKKKIGATNDFAGGIAALGGIAAMVGLFALLMPMHLLTSAITFLTSIVTFVTNVNNVFNTYLSVVDGVLSIFGIKNSTKTMKAFIGSILDNMFGKENVREAKNKFAASVNSISTTTKLLEKAQSMRNNTDSKIDEARLAIGTLNNAFAEEGMIPPELMESSKAVDKFVGDSKNAEELKENIDSLTDEIKDKEETNKLLDEERIAREKRQEQIDKDIASVRDLVDTAKSNFNGLDMTQF